MKRKNIINTLCGVACIAGGLTACTNDLNVTPINPQQTMEYNQDAVFNKIYASFCLTGQTGPAGNGDVPGDEGQSEFFRMMWYLNEFTTDEAHWVWATDAGVPDLLHNNYGESNAFSSGMYYRLYFTITLCNFFLEQATGTDAATLMQRAEVRFIRALNYMYVMDLYGNAAFTTRVSAELPIRYTRKEYFDFIENELKEIENDMAMPGGNSYGRVDRVAAWLILSRLYLNAEVYTGTARWADAATYAEKVINSNYKLAESYPALFMGDNDSNADAMQEIILPIAQHGNYTKTYSGSYFLIAATHTAGMPEWGSIDGWGGIPARKSLVDKFQYGNDDRALFHKTNEDGTLSDPNAFTSGWGVTKWNNLSAKESDLKAGILVPVVSNDPEVKVPETDIPFLRAAEAYLTYAEAKFRLGESGAAIEKFNALRTRANAQTVSNLTLELLRDEWSREFYFEGRRRTDLVRFNSFGGNTDYTWDWKAGVANGTRIDEKYNILPIPVSDMNANPNLVQNAGY